MAPKTLLMALALCGAFTIAGCTSGHDKGSSTSTSTSGAYGGGACVTGPNGAACANATASGSASASATSTSASSTNTSTNSTGSGTANVTVAAAGFSPQDVTIRVGGTVTWTDTDSSGSHTVTADDGTFDSHPGCTPPVTPLSNCMKNGETYGHTFPAAGTVWSYVSPFFMQLLSGVTGGVQPGCESNVPSSAVTVCEPLESVSVQVTVPPTRMVTSCGLKPAAATVTLAVPLPVELVLGFVLLALGLVEIG